MSCGVDRILGSDLVLLWLWCKLAATVPIRPLAWEHPYTTGAALKRPKKKKEEYICFGHSSLAMFEKPPVIPQLEFQVYIITR